MTSRICGVEHSREGKTRRNFSYVKKKKRKVIWGSWMSVVCGRVRKVADRVKGVKRGG